MFRSETNLAGGMRNLLEDMTWEAFQDFENALQKILNNRPAFCETSQIEPITFERDLICSLQNTRETRSHDIDLLERRAQFHAIEARQHMKNTFVTLE